MRPPYPMIVYAPHNAASVGMYYAPGAPNYYQPPVGVPPAGAPPGFAQPMNVRPAQPAR